MSWSGKKPFVILDWLWGGHLHQVKDLEKRGMCRTEEEKGGDEKGRARNAGK